MITNCLFHPFLFIALIRPQWRSILVPVSGFNSSRHFLSAWKHICHDPARAFATFRFVEERVVNQITDEELELILSLVQIRVLRHCTRCIRCWGKTWLRRLESHATVLQKFKGFRQKDKKGLLPVPSKRELTSMFERRVVPGMVPRAQTSSLSASTASAGH